MKSSRKPLLLQRPGIQIILVLLLLILSACGSGDIFGPKSTETATSLPPTKTPTVTLTPTTTSTATATATPTIIPTPLGGSANFIYVYYYVDGDDLETATASINIVRFEDSFSIPIAIETFRNIYTPPWISISPDGSRIMAVVDRENGSDLIEIDLQVANPSAQYIVTLPNNPWITGLGFSPNGNWVYVSFHFMRRDYVGFFEVETEKFLINYDCKEFIDFLDEDSAICRTGLSVNDMAKFSLEIFTNQNTFLKTPHSKLGNKTKTSWNFSDVLPQMNSYVLYLYDDGYKYHLVPSLDYYGPLSYWSSEDVDNLIDSPVIISEIPEEARLYQFLPSPDNKNIAAIGNNSNSRGSGQGIPPGTFSFVVNLDELYKPEDPQKPGIIFYPLRWSPDSRLMVGISHDGRGLSIWNPGTGEVEELFTFSGQPLIKYQNTDVFGIDALWLD